VLADRSDLSTLVAALGAVEGDLFEADDAGFTVFAPSDAAFGSLPAGSVEVLLATQPKLFELLGYHVVPGTLLSSDLADGQVLTTATGAELPVTITNGVIAVGDVAISEADIAATNGVVHIVDGVLIPPDYTLPTINEALSLEPITFETGSAVITADGIAVLQQAVDFLIANPDVRIGIEGHTDSQGGEASNQALSEARADSVRDYLVEQGIAADRLETAGFGESNPIASNDTADGRAQNRRIEFVIR
jgi:OOP family OmpA-OmpF porin